MSFRPENPGVQLLGETSRLFVQPNEEGSPPKKVSPSIDNSAPRIWALARQGSDLLCCTDLLLQHLACLLQLGGRSPTSRKVADM